MAFKGLDKHLRRLKRLQGDEVVRLANQVVYEGADTIRAEASRLITAGAVSGKNHVASKPGHPCQRWHLDVGGRSLMRGDSGTAFVQDWGGD